MTFLKNKKYLIILIFSFILFIFLNKSYFFQKFDSTIINQYLKSQDILDTQDLIKDRIFISDAEIYQASGYLYATGSNPIEYNFQHPPFLKYLFGFSSKIFNLALIPNIIFAAILLFEVYLLGDLIFKNKLIGFLASILLLADPVFKEVSIYTLLDLGQITLLIGFLIISLFYQKYYLLSGVLLGLAFASKFYSPVFIFLALIYIYKLINKKFNLKTETITLITAFLVFSLCYIKAFSINLPFYQAKIIKFMIDHNRANSWGEVIPIFIKGYIFWPVSFISSFYLLFKQKLKSVQFLFLIIPIIYFVIMTFQIPFTRYFILILPFTYLGLGKVIWTNIQLLHHGAKSVEGEKA